MSNGNKVKRLHKADDHGSDLYSLAVNGETIGTVSYTLAYEVMMGRISPAEAVEINAQKSSSTAKKPAGKSDEVQP